MSNEQQHNDGKFLTLVFHIESEGQRKALIHGAAWCAASDAHAIRERDTLVKERKKLLAESDKLRTELGDLQIQALRLGGERNKLQAERDKLLAERQERTQTMHIGIKFNDAEFVRAMQTLIAEHTSEDAAQLQAAKTTIEQMNAALGRLSDQCGELVKAKNTLQFENTTLQALLLEQKVARHQPAELSLAKITEIVESMPNGLAGFLGKWGLTKFARAVWAAAQKGGAA